MEVKLNIGYQELLDLVRQLPTHLQQQLKADMSDPPKNQPETKPKENLALIIKKMRINPMFEDIDNPVAWQKQLRDEWE